MVLILSLACVICASVISAATLGYVETWDTLGSVGGWARSSTVISLLNTGQDLRIRFGAQSGPPVSQEAVAYADIDASGGAFVGDYSNGAVASASFDFVPDSQVPSLLCLAFYSQGSDTMWFIRLPDPTVGITNSYTIPFTYKVVLDREPLHWSIGGGSTEEQFRQDIQDVTWIGVLIRRHGNTEAQVYHVDNFMLDDTPLPDPRYIDSDGDGHTDWDEAVAGTDPTDPDSALRIQIRPRTDGSGGVELLWNSVSGRKYKVLSSRKLDRGRGEFSVKHTDIYATPPMNRRSEVVDSPDEGMYFYILEVQK